MEIDPQLMGAIIGKEGSGLQKIKDAMKNHRDTECIMQITANPVRDGGTVGKVKLS